MVMNEQLIEELQHVPVMGHARNTFSFPVNFTVKEMTHEKPMTKHSSTGTSGVQRSAAKRK